MRQNDVLIVGAGPAGAWAARCLARAGASVTIFDASHPREKPCGGGLTARALALVGDELESGALEFLSPTSLLFESGSAFAEFPLPACGSPGSVLTIVERRTFDQMLLSAAVRAGARHVAERVRDIAVGPGGVEVAAASGRTRGSLLLGADGANSLVRRRVAASFARRQISIATGCFVHGVRSARLRIAAVAQPPGYIWSFPRTTHLAVGMCAQADTTSVGALQRIVSGWLAANRLAEGARVQPYSWPIPSLASADFRRERAAGDRWMLVGDAAGLVDPLTREGIYFALLSAEIASAAILGPTPPAAAYMQRLRAEVYPELARAADVKARFFTSGFTDLMVQGFARSAAIRQVMVDLIAGRQPYATLKRRLVRTFEIGLAWRLLWLQMMGRMEGRRRKSVDRRQ